MLFVAGTPALLLSGCGTSDWAAESTGRAFSYITDSVSVAAGLRPLREGRLPVGIRRELRAYIGFGSFVPQQVVRGLAGQDRSARLGWPVVAE